MTEVCDSSRFIDEWRDSEDQPVDFGNVPLEEDEALPAGALDDEEPDAQRLTEDTGNEGSTFELARIPPVPVEEDALPSCRRGYAWRDPNLRQVSPKAQAEWHRINCYAASIIVIPGNSCILNCN